MDFKIIAVDFDGTLCENKWPEIGEANMEIIKYLQKEKKKGAKIILWTCRTGKKLMNAILWCSVRGLVFDSVNENVPEAILEFGSDTRKVFAHEYIDDKTCNMFKLPFEKEPDDTLIVRANAFLNEKEMECVRKYILEQRTNGMFKDIIQ